MERNILDHTNKITEECNLIRNQSVVANRMIKPAIDVVGKLTKIINVLCLYSEGNSSSGAI